MANIFDQFDAPAAPKPPPASPVGNVFDQFDGKASMQQAGAMTEAAADPVAAVAPGLRQVEQQARAPDRPFKNAAGERVPEEDSRMLTGRSDEQIRFAGEVAASLVEIPGLSEAARARLGMKIAGLAARMLSSGATTAATSAALGGTTEDVIEAGAGAAAGTGVGAAVANVAGKVVAPFANLVDEGLAEAQKLLGKTGIITPGKATESPILATLESAADVSVFSPSRIAATQKNAVDVLTTKVDEFAAAFRSQSSKEDVGALVQESLEGASNAFRETARANYAFVDSAFGNTLVDIGPVKALAEKLATRSNKGVRSPEIDNLVASIFSKGQKTPRQELRVPGRAPTQARLEGQVYTPGGTFTIKGRGGAPDRSVAVPQTKEPDQTVRFAGEPERKFVLPEQVDDLVDWQTAQAIRSDLLGIGRNSTELVAGKAKGAAGELAGAMDKAMGSTAQKLSGDALTAWRSANEFWKAGVEEFNSRLVKSLARAEPEAVITAFAKNNRPGSIRRVREIVGPESWREVQGQYLADVIGKATDDITGSGLDGVKMLKQFRSMGDGLREMFPDRAQREQLENLANALRIAQKQTGKKAMVMGVSADVGAGVGSAILTYQAASNALQGDQLAAGANLAGAVSLALTPKVLGRILTNPTAVQWLTTGLKVPAGAKEGIEAVTKLTTFLTAEGLMGD